MKVGVAVVGSASRLLAPAIAEYEARAARYWKLDVTEVRAERAARNRPITAVRAAEAERLRAAVPAGADLVALTRNGAGWSSEALARYLNDLAVAAAAGVTFIIGGAHGLDRGLLKAADHQLSLAPVTLPHELARLVLAEQIYRAGTIIRGEPYHKG